MSPGVHINLAATAADLRHTAREEIARSSEDAQARIRRLSSPVLTRAFPYLTAVLHADAAD
jgi:hypothetical protein